MFDIGFWELCIIGVVGLLVIGPERLPGVARTLGKYVGKAQRMVAGVKSDIRRELEAGELRDLLGEQKKQIEELQGLVSETKAEMEASTRAAVQSAEKSWTEDVAESHAKAAGEQAENTILPPGQDAGAETGDTTPASSGDDDQTRKTA